MTHKKVMAGLAVATVSVATAGIAQADEVTPTLTTDVTTLDTQPQAEVSQETVAEAKAAFDQSQEGVNHQETVVKEAQKAKDQAQLALSNATIAVSQAQELANQASPETIAQAKEAVTEATHNLATAQKQLEETQATATTAQEAVATQETIVTNNQTTVANAQKEVNDAQEAVEVANQAIDEISAQTELTAAQADLTEKNNHVKEAQEQLEEAKTADEALMAKRQEAQADLDQKTLAKTETDTLLKQVGTEMAKEQVSTSLQDHAYYNQRDAIWASYYGNGSFAATGCVPASLAMVFTELARRGITPTQVADYLYNNTNYFNKTFSGTSAHGIVAATKHFGFVPTQLASQSAIIEALQAGHHVVGAVQNNKFSPWGAGYSHEVVLRGYSNGNTYVYDPYNRANIGWYPVASLWAEQSQDKDDRALGAPFFKIITQKMSELETQKVKASSAVQTATRQLADAKATLTKLQSTALRVPGAQEALNQARADLSQAEANVVKAQEAVRLASQELAQKETNLKEAQAELSLKETALSEAKEVLVASQAKLETLKATAKAAEEAVSQAKKTLETAKQALTQQETRLAGLEDAPARLAKTQEVLVAAKTDLAQKTQVFEQAQAELETLKTLAYEAQTHYMTVLSAYQASVEKEQQVQLKADYHTIKQSGMQAVPVVDETGKVVSVIGDKSIQNDKPSTNLVSLTSLSSEKEYEQTLPETGESGSILGLVGFSLISLLGLVGLKRKA
ncbi:TPA: C39 family peptidase [Streptococcus equi subsp. zooepidemicus]|uniref:M protein n=1 Tax=Streptococcus equi subsp. zooepidemicus Sz4is TaxID=1381082 RepID=A0AAW3GPY9_STRSZ|nr:M protein [Streptococcus equi subsp. zooepidemicus Sz4is]HEL0009520.1 C39 family peptidase [Streptococcus equi subsp. zooepidemicus]HEL0011594.1 C39 family peptidase [Streptococcus equi subsp. zooepidemicus]HEL0014117.1 C39 family peptidase [Streptococcus equi subsp. zooepidemicus]HEL0018151.1 C39 family peptidase [Streptococcus equi subsp. zooepidemicus]